MLRYILLLSAATFAASLVAQEPPVLADPADYDVWKAQFMTPGEPTGPTHPSEQAAAEDEEDNSRGGSATCNCWVEPDATYTTVNNTNGWQNGNGDDGYLGPVNLPFGFYLYGQTYTSAYININGSVSFGQGVGTYSSSSFPTSGPSLVAPFWADVDLRGGGVNLNKVQYKVTPGALYVNWSKVGYYNTQTDKLNSFQVVITDGVNPAVPNGANVSFCYGTMQWTTGSASQGTNGFGGTPATVGANKGDGVNYMQFGRFDHPGMDYNGPSGVSGIGWLTDKYFTFSTSVTTGNVPPVVTGQSVCDSLTVCAGQVTQLNVDFLSPEPGQTTVPTSYANTLSNYTTIEAITGNTASITTQFTPLPSEVGFHEVFFEGADDGLPPLTSVFRIVIEVLPSPELVSDSLVVCDNEAPFDMLTVLGGNAPPGGTWKAPDGSSHNNMFLPGEDVNGDYTYSVGIGTSCSATGVATITNMPHAFAGGDIDIAYCSWDLPDNLFNRIPDSPQSGGAWTNPAGATFNGTLDPPTAEPGVYQYQVNGTAPCPNDTSFLTIAIPRSVDAGADSSIAFCVDAAPFSMRSKLGGTPDATGTWSDVNGAPIPELFDPATGSIGVYTYTVPAVLPCPVQTAILTINIDPLPRAGLDSSLVICANGGNTPLFPLLKGSPNTGGHWLTPMGDELSGGLLDPKLELSGDYLYVAIGPGTCAHRSDTSVVNVHIDPLPVISFTADPDSGCNPLEVNFTNTTDLVYVGNSCVWDPGDGTGTVDACGSYTHTYAEAGWYHVKLRVTTPQGCTDQLIVPGAVLVDPAPKAEFVYTPNPGTAGNSRLVFSATDPHAVDHQWTFPDGSQQTGRQASYTFPDKIADEYLVCLSVLDRYGCADTLCDTIPILVSNLWIPTGFTPDGNGINDIFMPVMLDMAPEDYHMQVFDRWGQLVFESKDPNNGWDGSGKGGARSADGAYVWRIEFRPMHTADKVVRFGTVTLSK